MTGNESLCDCLRIHGMALCTGGGCRNAAPTKPRSGWAAKELRASEREIKKPIDSLLASSNACLKREQTGD